MEQDVSWKAHFEAELYRAANARAAGNEGMARVCARRAAGIAIGAYLEREKIPDPSPSAYDRLRYLTHLDSIPEEVRAVAAHFLIRITPDKQLPVEADLIVEAHWLCTQLIPEYPDDIEG